MQTEAVVASPRVHDHFDSTAHTELHPSPDVVPPSSQYPATGLMTFASPHKSDQTLAVEESPNVHCQSASTAQVALHPFPEVVPPSSQ